MGKLTGFIEYVRETNPMRPEEERVKDWKEVYVLREEKTCETQGARCMDCGVPFCHRGEMMEGGASGCPINNLIPEWNDLIYRGRWRKRLIACITPITFRSLPVGYVQRPVRRAAYYRSTSPPLRFTIMSVRLSIKGLKWVGWSLSHQTFAPIRRLP